MIDKKPLRITPTNSAYRLIEILGEVGEYPKSSLYLFGGEQRIVLRRINLLCEENDLKIIRLATADLPELRLEYQKPLFQSVGEGHRKGVRLTKAGQDALELIYPITAQFYDKAFEHSKFGSTERHRDRYHRCAETVAMFKFAGIETLPVNLPELVRDGSYSPVTQIAQLGYYPSRSVKDAGEFEELDKTSYTRYCGIFFGDGICYPVYNTRNAIMKWSASGELKAKYDISMIARINAGIQEVEDAILFGFPKTECKLKKMTDGKDGLMAYGLFGCYYNIHFIPLNQDGIAMLQLFQIKDWHHTLLHTLYDDDDENEVRDRDTDTFPYDIISDTAFTLSYLDGDVGRLLRFIRAASDDSARRGRKMILLCFEHQVDTCKELIAGLNIELRAARIATVKRLLFETANHCN